jgi:replicative DNA helicase
MVVFIHRPEYYKIMTDPEGNSNEGIAEIIIAKHRSGSVGDVRLQFTKELIKFSNTDEKPYRSFSSSASAITQDFGSRSNDIMPIEPSNEAPF